MIQLLRKSFNDNWNLRPLWTKFHSFFVETGEAGLDTEFYNAVGEYWKKL